MPETVLNIGCGSKKEGTINVDVNSAVKPDVTCDGNFLPFKNEAFDKCILRHMLEHTDRPDQLMDECYRTLKMAGLVYVTFPNFASFTVLLEWVSRKPAYSVDLVLGNVADPAKWQWHKHLCTTITVKSLLRRHRFSIKGIAGHPPNIGPRMMQILGASLVRLFPDRAGNVTVIGKKSAREKRSAHALFISHNRNMSDRE